MQRNIKKLKEESLKPNPAKSSIIPLQKSTFNLRREFILSGLDKTEEILDEHPVLKLPFAVSCFIVYTAYLAILLYRLR